MSDLSVSSAKLNMYNKNALVAFLIYGFGYATETCPNMSLSHSNLTELPHAPDSTLGASSGDSSNCELTSDTALSTDTDGADVV